MKSTIVFLLLIILQANCALTGEDIKVEPIFIPNGICQKPKENDYVTLSYTWKLDDVNERLALQLHMGNSKYPGLEEIVKDMCKLQKNIVKIPAQVRFQVCFHPVSFYEISSLRSQNLLFLALPWKTCT